MLDTEFCQNGRAACAGWYLLGVLDILCHAFTARRKLSVHLVNCLHLIRWGSCENVPDGNGHTLIVHCMYFGMHTGTFTRNTIFRFVKCTLIVQIIDHALQVGVEICIVRAADACLRGCHLDAIVETNGCNVSRTARCVSMCVFHLPCTFLRDVVQEGVIRSSRGVFNSSRVLSSSGIVL